MAEAAVTCEMKGDGIAVVTLNRPKQMNALNPEAIVRLATLFKELNQNDECRVVIITGAGDKVFCAGADLKSLVSLITGARKPKDEWDEKLVADMSQSSAALLRDDAALEKPVIAAINGSALAGGCELAQGTDIRVCADHAKIGLSEAKRGLFPAGGSTVRMPRQVPYARAMEILLTAEPISALEAKEIGFLNYVVPKEQVMAKALEIASKIASNGPVAVQQIRKSVKAILSEPNISEAMKIETKHANVVFAHPDAKEGPLAFAQKRVPVWGKSKL